MVARMKDAAILLGFLVAAMPATAAERRYSLADFDRIQIEGPYQVRLTTGVATSGRASGSRQALDRLSIDVQGSTLRVRPNRSSWGGYPGQAADPPPTITLSTRALRSVAVSGSGGLSIDKARAAKLDVALAGSGRISIGNVDVDAFGLSLLGAGQVTLAGRAKQAKLIVQGSGAVEGAAFRADDLQVNAESAGNVALAAGRTAKVRSAGSGDVTISGNAACTFEALGSGAVRCGK
jgi:hypothetical protein